MGVSDDRPQREAAQVEPGAFAGDGAGEYPDNWAKQGAAAAPNGGDPEGPFCRSGEARFVMPGQAMGQPLRMAL